MQSVRGAMVVVVAGVLLACSPKPAEQQLDPQIAKAEAGPVKEVVRSAMLDAQKQGRRLVVYVGAEWCEPCHVFLEGVAAGKLPPSLNNIRILKFDNDVDDARLEAANYGGQMIPRFVKPGKDGTGSRLRFEGSVKGPAALDNIIPRLEALVSESQRPR